MGKISCRWLVGLVLAAVSVAFAADDRPAEPAAKGSATREPQYVTRVYDIRDLVAGVPDFTDSPELAMLPAGPPGGGGGGGRRRLFGNARSGSSARATRG